MRNPMLQKKCVMLLFISMLVTVPALEASQPARQYLDGLAAYQAQNYAEAIQHFESIAQNGVVNGKLYYNLGNAYLKDNQLGTAILWYERALRFIPEDPDLRFNLAYARSLTKDAPEQESGSLVRIFFFWKYQLSPPAIRAVAIGANTLFWLLMGGWLMMPKRGLLRAAKVAFVVVVVFGLTAGYNYYEAGHRRQGVVLPDEAAVRSGLSTDATQLFVLHAGANVSIVKEHNDHYQIRFTADKIGWVTKDVVGVI